MKKNCHCLNKIITWVLVLWIVKVFLTSIPYKFSAHPDTQHIFGTIGEWLKAFFGNTTGQLFSDYGAYVIGSAEILASVLLLLPAILWLTAKSGITKRFASEPFHCLGGLLASAIMTGAVFFHLVSPLGIEVIHQGKGDGGALFYTAVSILVMGVIIFAFNGRKIQNPFKN